MESLESAIKQLPEKLQEEFKLLQDKGKKYDEMIAASSMHTWGAKAKYVEVSNGNKRVTCNGGKTD